MGLIKFTRTDTGSLVSAVASHVVSFTDCGDNRLVNLDDGSWFTTDATLEFLETAYLAASGHDVTNG